MKAAPIRRSISCRASTASLNQGYVAEAFVRLDQVEEGALDVGPGGRGEARAVDPRLRTDLRHDADHLERDRFALAVTVQPQDEVGDVPGEEPDVFDQVCLLVGELCQHFCFGDQVHGVRPAPVVVLGVEVDLLDVAGHRSDQDLGLLVPLEVAEEAEDRVVLGLGVRLGDFALVEEVRDGFGDGWLFGHVEHGAVHHE